MNLVTILKIDLFSMLIFFLNLFLAVLCLLAVRRLSQGREGLISLPCFSLQWLLLLQSTGPSARELQ